MLNENRLSSHQSNGSDQTLRYNDFELIVHRAQQATQIHTNIDELPSLDNSKVGLLPGRKIIQPRHKTLAHQK
jgi:hypothetical protein